MKRTALALVFVVSLLVLAQPVASQVVISEFRFRGPNGGSDEFVELLNISGAPVDISGWKINGSNSAGTTSTRVTIAASTILQPGCHYLVTNNSTSGGPYSGPVAGSQTYATGITDDGGVALLTATNGIIDQVGLSGGSLYKEGTVLASLGSSNLNRGYARKNNGFLDTANNANDFELVSPSGPENGCPGPASTPPTGAATASPTSLGVGDSILFTVNVTPGANPTSTGIGVTGDLTPIGGTSAQSLFDNGTHGDAVANDNIFSLATTVAAGTSGGAKTFAFTITDAQSRTATAFVTGTVLAPTNPTGVGSANPSSVERNASTVLSVTVTPGLSPASTGIAVIGDLSSIGGAASQAFSANGNVFSFSATILSATTLGAKTIPITITDAQSRTSSMTIALTVVAPTIVPGTIVISQIYGGGGNAGSTLKNDFIELFNRSNNPVSVDGWSVQHFSSSNPTWFATPLSGVIQPHSYYLVQEAAGTTPGGGTVPLPTPDATGDIGVSSTAGTVALSTSTTLLPAGICSTRSDVIDFVGYGTGSSCSGRVAIGPALSNTVGASRTLGGCTYTNSATDFAVGPPAPRNSATPANDCSTAVDATTPHVMISQLYGGGGNSGATYSNDFVELYNPTDVDVPLDGWSIQYASSTGSGWGSNSQPLGGSIPSHGYFLIELAAGATPSTPLPPPRIIGSINMSASSGKLALVNRFEPLSGNCPIGDPALVDFIGYGSADCFEGGLAAPSLANNAQSLVRSTNSDTNQNSVDFSRLTPPNPRGTGELVELPPLVSSFEPQPTAAPYDASITVNFSEPVNVADGWFNISCTSTGPHTDVEVASAFGGRTWIITPNVTFTPGETCTVHIFKSLVTDQDTNDGPNTDNLPTDFEWSFTIATGTPVETADVHLTMGNPSDAIPSLALPNNYLMEKPEYALSYNRDRGTANWVSWHLADEWTSAVSRTDTFRPDPALPPTWYRVLQTDYSGSGFDRGHMCPSADRNISIPINQATFLMTNMVPQSPDNNQGPWEQFESYLRTLLPVNELYIVSGPLGEGGTGSNGFATRVANGQVTVPESTWKVALVLPKMAGDDVGRVTASTRTIAIRIQNIQGIKDSDWHQYLTTVRGVEQLTGYNFFSNVPAIIQNSIERGIDGTNPPGVDDESLSTPEDTANAVTLNAVSPDTGATFTYTVGNPAHGSVTPTSATGTYTYTPAPDFNGNDSFTFSVNDGHFDSNTSTVTVHVSEVNDAPVAANDVSNVEAGSTLSIPATALTSNDSPGPANEISQTLTVTAVTSTAATHGNVSLTGGQVTYTPAIPYAGPAGFTYTVCDNGTTNGNPDSKCATGTVSVNVNDSTPPSISTVTPSVTQLWPPNHKMVDVTVAYGASDFGDPTPVCSLQVSSNEPINGTGDGDTAPDWQIVDGHHVRLRAERAGTGSGRIYTITTNCADATANAAQSSATVVVPKSQK